MKRVGSAPQLNGGGDHVGHSHHLPSTASAMGHAGSPGLIISSHKLGSKKVLQSAPTRAAFVKSKPMPRNSSEESLRTRAVLGTDIYVPPTEHVAQTNSGQESVEVAYAVVSKGLAATECLSTIELEEAPSLVGKQGSFKREVAAELAACMATPVLPDDTNGEIVNRRAAQLESEIQRNIKERYAQEVSRFAPEASRRRLGRKRSLGDAMPEDCSDSDDNINVHYNNILLESELEVRSGSKKNDISAEDLTQQEIDILNKQIEECQAKHTLVSEDYDESNTPYEVLPDISPKMNEVVDDRGSVPSLPVSNVVPFGQRSIKKSTTSP